MNIENDLPEGNEYLVSKKNYISPSQLLEGEYVFRIVQKPIGGWIDWKENKPYRYKPQDKPAKPFNDERPIRCFWACYVWDYKQKDFYILNITQATIIRALTNLGSDSAWGSILNYDVKIKKEGSGQTSVYAVSPIPPKPLDKEIVLLLEKSPVNLEQLYSGQDPWCSSDNNDSITEEEGERLELRLHGHDILRENVLNMIEKTGLERSLYNLPSKYYESIIARIDADNKQKEEASKKVSLADAMGVEAELPF